MKSKYSVIQLEQGNWGRQVGWGNGKACFELFACVYMCVWVCRHQCVLSLDHAALWVMLPERLIVLQKVNNSRAETPLTAAGGMRYAQALGNRITLPTSVSVFLFIYLWLWQSPVFANHHAFIQAINTNSLVALVKLHSLPHQWDNEGQSEQTTVNHQDEIFCFDWL